MNSNLLLDFTVDQENKTITVRREFDAERQLVWDAWTKAELLDQWWAPKPYRNRTKTMDFREGGHWLYAMISPKEEVHWCRADYLKIEHRRRFSATDAFCDEAGNINETFPRAQWNNVFTDHAGNMTLVNITITYGDLADLEKVLAMGFQDGFTMGLGNLDELLLTLKQHTKMNQNKITIEALISAPTERVWEIWTEPAHITRWNFATDEWHCPRAENDLRVGGKYFARMEAKDGGMGFDFEAVYDEVVAYKTMTYTLADGRQVTTAFENAGGATKVVTTFDAEADNPADMQRAGWQAILNNFKRYTEAQ